MARIVISSWGSAGDLNPYIAVGHELRERGHDVCCAVEEELEPPFHAARLATHRLAGNSGQMLQPHMRDIYANESPDAGTQTLFSKVIFPLLPTHIAALRDACAGADLLVSSAFQLAASFLSDLTGIAWASMALVPSGILSREINGPLNIFRARYGLPPLGDDAPAGNLSPECTVVTVSPSFIPQPLDWPRSYQMTGFCFWDGGETWTEPPELTAFLAGGTPVVALSCGSMSRDVPGAFDTTFRTGIAAIRRAGVRALVIGAPAGVLPDPLPDGVFALPYAPFSRVYPQCAAVIHHGGIGTTAQGLRASVPALVVPWGMDQFATTASIAEAGVGRRLTKDEFTEERAAAEIRLLLTDSTFGTRTREIAARINREDGVRTTCDTIEGFLARSSGATRSGIRDNHV